MKLFRRVTGLLTAAALSFTAVSVAPSEKVSTLEAEAASEKYAVQEFRLGIGDTNRSVTISGTDSGSFLSSQKDQGTRDEKWYLNFVSDGTFEIVSSATGYIVTNDGGSATVKPDVDGANQRWNIVGVEKDFEGYYLYYKIVSASDGSTALTFNAGSNSVSAQSYTGDLYQKFKLNLDGLQGYAANCIVDDNEKAGTIGGLLGETVFVSTTDEMINAMASTKPLTIVMTKTLDFHPFGQLVINSDKTLTSYYGVTLKDCQLRTCPNDTSSSTPPSDNLVFRNMNFLAHESTNCELFNIYSSRQIWIDHCYFESKLGKTVDEVGKFIWCNTPFDGTWKSRATDYMTISYCKFYNRYWTTLFASVSYEVPDNEKIRCRVSFLYPFYDQCVRRCPQLGSAYGHLISGFWRGTEGQNDSGTDEIIGGGQTDVVSQNCRFEGIDSGHEICAGGGSEPYRDDNSYTAKNANSTPAKLNFTAKVTSTRHPETENYGYSLVAPVGDKNAKDFCLNYCGSASSYDKLKYITDSDMSEWIEKTYPDFFKKDIEVSNGAVLDENAVYSFRNLNSGLYLEVENGTAANGTNVMQGKSGNRNADLWTVKNAGNGYYYLYTKADEGGALCLDLPYGSADNGTSLGIWTNDESDARKFRFVPNPDGTYTIATKSSGDKSCLGVASDSAETGADVIQWEKNGGDAQKWEILTNGRLISNFKCLDTEHSASWSISDGLKAGSELFGDRDVTYSEIPEELIGAEYIKTACDAKGVSTDLGEFEAASDCTVYVALDSRMPAVPAWLSSWTKTALTVKNSNDVLFELYVKEVKAGETVVLGANNYSNSVVNYTVIVAEKAVEITTTTAAETTTTTTTEAETTTEAITTTTTEAETSATTAEEQTTTTTITATAAETTAVTTTAAPDDLPEPKVYGDATNDGSVWLNDAVLIMQAIANPNKFGINGTDDLHITPQGWANADCYKPGDGVTPKDALSIQMILLKLIDTLPTND